MVATELQGSSRDSTDSNKYLPVNFQMFRESGFGEQGSARRISGKTKIHW